MSIWLTYMGPHIPQSFIFIFCLHLHLYWLETHSAGELNKCYTIQMSLQLHKTVIADAVQMMMNFASLTQRQSVPSVVTVDVEDTLKGFRRPISTECTVCLSFQKDPLTSLFASVLFSFSRLITSYELTETEQFIRPKWTEVGEHSSLNGV